MSVITEADKKIKKMSKNTVSGKEPFIKLAQSFGSIFLRQT